MSRRLNAARVKDLCPGHDCHPPRGAGTGSPDVFINGRAAHRLGDQWEEHVCFLEGHGGETIAGSATIFINNIPASRITDEMVCIEDNEIINEGFIMTGSPNVFFDDTKIMKPRDQIGKS